MNKAQFIEEVAGAAGLSKSVTESVVKAFVDTVSKELKEGGRVTLTGFGTFEVRRREGRVGWNPRTKERIEIKAANAPAFKAGKALKEFVN